MKHSLRGLRILNTRPKAQALALSQQINAAGGKVIELPTLEIKATTEWLSLLPDLTTVDQAIFVSANAVIHCFDQLKSHHLAWPNTIKVIAIGQGSAKALQELGISITAIPEIPDSEHLLALPTLANPNAQTILLFKGQGGRPLIEKTLLAKGANLQILEVYQRVMPKINQQFVKSIWRDDLVDIILFMSEQSMHHLFQFFGKEAYPWLCNKTSLVISERLAQSAASLGIKNIICSHPDRIISALFDYVSKD